MFKITKIIGEPITNLRYTAFYPDEYFLTGANDKEISVPTYMYEGNAPWFSNNGLVEKGKRGVYQTGFFVKPKITSDGKYAVVCINDAQKVDQIVIHGQSTIGVKAPVPRAWMIVDENGEVVKLPERENCETISQFLNLEPVVMGNSILCVVHPFESDYKMMVLTDGKFSKINESEMKLFNNLASFVKEENEKKHAADLLV